MVVRFTLSEATKYKRKLELAIGADITATREAQLRERDLQAARKVVEEQRRQERLRELQQEREREENEKKEKLQKLEDAKQALTDRKLMYRNFRESNGATPEKEPQQHSALGSPTTVTTEEREAKEAIVNRLKRSAKWSVASADPLFVDDNEAAAQQLSFRPDMTDQNERDSYITKRDEYRAEEVKKEKMLQVVQGSGEAGPSRSSSTTTDDPLAHLLPSASTGSRTSTTNTNQRAASAMASSSSLALSSPAAAAGRSTSAMQVRSTKGPPPPLGSRPPSVQDIIEKRRHWISYQTASEPAPPPVSYDVLGDGNNYEALDIVEDDSVFGASAAPRSGAPPRDVLRARRAQRLDTKTMNLELQKFKLEDTLRAATADRVLLLRAEAKLVQKDMARKIAASNAIKELKESELRLNDELMPEIERLKQQRLQKRQEEEEAATYKRTHFEPRMASPWGTYGALLRPLHSRPSTAVAAVTGTGSTQESNVGDGAVTSPKTTSAASTAATMRPSSAAFLAKNSISDAAEQEAVVIPVEAPPPRSQFQLEKLEATKRRAEEVVRMRGLEVSRVEETAEPQARDVILREEAQLFVVFPAMRSLVCYNEPHQRVQILLHQEKREWQSIVAAFSGETERLQLKEWMPDVLRDRSHLEKREQERLVAMEESRKLLKAVSEANVEKERDVWRKRWQQQQNDRAEMLDIQKKKTKRRDEMKWIKLRLQQLEDERCRVIVGQQRDADEGSDAAAAGTPAKRLIMPAEDDEEEDGSSMTAMSTPPPVVPQQQQGGAAVLPYSVLRAQLLASTPQKTPQKQGVGRAATAGTSRPHPHERMSAAGALSPAPSQKVDGKPPLTPSRRSGTATATTITSSSTPPPCNTQPSSRASTPPTPSAISPELAEEFQRQHEGLGTSSPTTLRTTLRQRLEYLQWEAEQDEARLEEKRRFLHTA